MNQYLVESDWITSDYKAQVVPLRFADSIGDIGRPRLAKLLRAIPVAIRIIFTCISNRPSIAYFSFAPTGFALWRDASFLAILKAFRVRTILHLHGKGLGPDAASPRTRRLYRWAFHGSTVICLSEGLYEEVSDVLPRQQLRILPNGVPDTWQDSSHRGRKPSQGSVQLLFLSNLLREKGIFELLDACVALRNQGKRVELTFVGPFPEPGTRTEFESRVADAGAGTYIHWKGPSYGDDRMAVMSKMDAFVFPSYYKPEAFPLVILEAMAAGLPVIASRNGAIPEMVQDGVTGYLVKPRDSASLTNAISLIVDDANLREQMGRAGRQRYEREYDLTRYLSRLQAIFEEQLTVSATAGRSETAQGVSR